MKFMKLALSLARKSNPSPNPRVGAVVVKNGKIIGKGYHKRAGMPHAEIEAMRNAERRGHDVKGATLYITLEPCCHSNKRTPPCTKAIIGKGISEVICAMKDPNPHVNGKGIKELRRNGIDVSVGMLEKEVREINKGYIKSMEKGLPYVAVKMAMSLDGKIATEGGESKWISCRKSRDIVHKLRKEYDAVMVGVNTVLSDNPSFIQNPVRIIVDSGLRTPENAKIFDSGKVIILTTKKSKSPGVKFVVTKGKRVDLRQAFKELPKLGVLSILAEGGGELNGSLFDEKLVDRIYFFTAPKIIGGKNAKTPVEGDGIKKLKNAVRIKLKTRKTGDDFLFEGDVC
jgi:diaminohydroxyphosphoribosylaminopyrimidine deaminase/5-amino-6-(5-phosphoribosylamino)uracil reductase